MLGDAHSTNWAENYQFFLNQNNPTNFERRLAAVVSPLHAGSASIDAPAGAVRPGDGFLGHPEAGQGGRSTRRRRTSTTSSSPPRRSARSRAKRDEILTNTVVIHFFPNSWDLNKKVTKEVDGKAVEELYDPNVDLVLKRSAKLAGQFGAARIIIEGHTDGSMKGQVPADVVKELSAEPGQRGEGGAGARSTRSSIPDRFNVDGLGWDRPADPTDPDNHAKNRRVEIKVYTAEKQ